MASNHGQKKKLCYICQDYGDHTSARCPNSICKNCGGRGHVNKHCLVKKPMEAIQPNKNIKSSFAPRYLLTPKTPPKSTKADRLVAMNSLYNQAVSIADSKTSSHEAPSLESFEDGNLDDQEIFETIPLRLSPRKRKQSDRQSSLEDSDSRFRHVVLYIPQLTLELFTLKVGLYRVKLGSIQP